MRNMKIRILSTSISNLENDNSVKKFSIFANILNNNTFCTHLSNVNVEVCDILHFNHYEEIIEI